VWRIEMFWNRKSELEKRKELRLNALQLEKLLKRAIENANSSIDAFDNSMKSRYGLFEENKDSRLFSILTETSTSKRFIHHNKEILSEIKLILSNKSLYVPSLIRESLSNVQEKNENANIMFSVVNEVLKEEKDKSPTWYFSRMISLHGDLRTDLLKVVSSLNDLNDLLHRHFEISSFDFVHENRFEELRNLNNTDFDLSKLIRLCEELNSAFQNGNYLSIAMLVRAILDHVPPIFGYKTFIEVANNYGGKSLKKSLQNLQNSSSNIADAYLHEPIRKKESLPNEIQVDFRSDLDVLLAEIVRVLK